jgi:hypothetical protein
MPSTDLMVSQGHSILVEGHLICAGLLENEINCYRAHCDDLPDEFEYFHLEFQDQEVLVLSNGTATASYVNTQSRMMFDSYQEYVDLYGDLNAEITPIEYKYPRTQCFLDPYKWVVRRSFEEPVAASWVGQSKAVVSGISLMLFELAAFCISASLSKIAIVKAPAGIAGVSVA